MSFENVVQARDRIEGIVKKTPVFTCSTLDELVDRQVYFKGEFLQKTGSFKARGALNAVSKTSTLLEYFHETLTS